MVWLNGVCDRCGKSLEYKNDNGHEVESTIDKNGHKHYRGRCINGHRIHIIDFYSNGLHIGREYKGRAVIA